jgi:hypothetical protein
MGTTATLAPGKIRRIVSLCIAGTLTALLLLLLISHIITQVKIENA